jgi:taurine--2-oxoglutarate transaminase
MVRQHVYDSIKDRYFAGGLTYSGHPLACAVAVASIEAFREEGVVENSQACGSYLADELPKLAERHPSVGEARGLGLFWGLELVRNRETREPLVPFNAGGEAAEPVVRMTKACLERGLYPFVHWNVFTIVPPLTITREELDEGLEILDDVLAIADEYYTG